jgi:hypothetical protein
MLGHADLGTTEVYTHVSAAHVKEAYRRLRNHAGAQGARHQNVTPMEAAVASHSRLRMSVFHRPTWILARRIRACRGRRVEELRQHFGLDDVGDSAPVLFLSQSAIGRTSEVLLSAGCQT